MKVPLDREAVVAGRFYPSSANQLEKQIQELFSEAESLVDYQHTPNNQNLLAIVSPHAGYVFSGVVAASAFEILKDLKPRKRVFLIGSSHHVEFNGASVYKNGNYITPLGTAKVDTNLAEELIAASEYFTFQPDAHSSEHSLEVQLPFLQSVWSNSYKLVPIVIATRSKNTCKEIATILKPYFNEENLFIISTDLSHYPEYDAAVKTDKKTIDAVLTNKPEKLLEQIKINEENKIPHLATSMCGWTSVLSLMHLSHDKQGTHIIPVLYQNSGDSKRYGEKDRVVGYQSLAVYSEDISFSLNQSEKVEILSLARRSVEEYLASDKRIDLEYSSLSPKLNTECGAFVSLYVNNKLRGCIGRIQASEPLTLVIRNMAIAAATNDNRFQAIKPEELDDLKIEISVLTPMKKIKGIEEFELGKHGIYIRKGYQSGTFLPQVADKTNWTAKEFLGHCSKDKAGIGWEGWKSADLYTYEAIVFKEE